MKRSTIPPKDFQRRQFLEDLAARLFQKKNSQILDLQVHYTYLPQVATRFK